MAREVRSVGSRTEAAVDIGDGEWIPDAAGNVEEVCKDERGHAGQVEEVC